MLFLKFVEKNSSTDTLYVCNGYLSYHWRYCHYIYVALMGEDKGVHRMLVGKPEGKRPLGWPRRRWEDNIKM